MFRPMLRMLIIIMHAVIRVRSKRITVRFMPTKVGWAGGGVQYREVGIFESRPGSSFRSYGSSVFTKRGYLACNSMNMKLRELNILVFLCILFMATKCPKDKERESNKKFNIHGILLKTCSNPDGVSGRNLELWYYGTASGEDFLKGTATTDENGEFSFSYFETTNSVNSSLSIIEPVALGQKTWVSNIPQNKNIDVGGVYTDTNFFVIAKVRTAKSYTNQDTLFYYLDNSVKHMIVGPFHNEQILDTLISYHIKRWAFGVTDPTYSYNTRWMLGTMYFDPKHQNQVNIPVVVCKKYNEVILDLTKAIF
jgi:hypothetical protein